MWFRFCNLTNLIWWQLIMLTFLQMKLVLMILTMIVFFCFFVLFVCLFVLSRVTFSIVKIYQEVMSVEYSEYSGVTGGGGREAECPQRLLTGKFLLTYRERWGKEKMEKVWFFFLCLRKALHILVKERLLFKVYVSAKVVDLVGLLNWSTVSQIMAAIVGVNSRGGFLVQRSIRGRAAEMGLKISLLV